ncbi:hypothetical protein A6J39_001810 [Legionella anisa]|uniref:Uncharacterized protein n=1 Tax=Legionella anisa TaxID=28082 RepID=A0AAX0WPP9_9GAMM|nr:hypothetical protein A6J39_001810 [Legionella anisa]
MHEVCLVSMVLLRDIFRNGVLPIDYQSKEIKTSLMFLVHPNLLISEIEKNYPGSKRGDDKKLPTLRTFRGRKRKCNKGRVKLMGKTENALIKDSIL